MTMQALDYTTIKALAKECGHKVTDLIVLSPQNDPFYVGTPTDRAQAEWFKRVWDATGFSKAHVRRMHYWTMTRGDWLQHNGVPYENTKECWSYMNKACKAARYLGLVAISDVVDRRNPDPYILARYGTGRNAQFEVEAPELEDPAIWIGDGDGFNLSSVQPYHMELWFEKSTMNDVLLPVCQDYGANLVTGLGEMSISSVYDLVLRIRDAGKPARIFYGSDFDPAGHSMPRAVARKLEWMLDRFEVDTEAKLTQLVLTPQQVHEYQLPRVPITEKERRADGFEDKFGVGAVELDALEAIYPGELAGIVRNALDPYFSHEAAREARRRERVLRRVIRERVVEITGRYSAEIRALDTMRHELSSIEIPNLEKYEPEPGEPLAYDNSDSWLFDSNRDYLEQLEAFKRYGDGKLVGEER